MSPLRAFLLFLSMTLVICAKGNYSQHKCPDINMLYKELECAPVGPGYCAKRFDCTHIELRSPHKCYLGYMAYKPEESVSEKENHSPCSVGCYCNLGGSFTCAHIDCPEFLGHRPDDNCIAQYRLGECCIQDAVCEENEIAKLATCELDGKIYKEGERMHSSFVPCSQCICSKGFTGKIEEPFCKPYYCGIDLHYTRNLQNNCAPIYYGNTSCCPIGWICDDEDKIEISASKNKTDDSDMVCIFGERKLNWGDSFMSKKEKCTTCSCQVPPFVSCVKDPVCDAKH